MITRTLLLAKRAFPVIWRTLLAGALGLLLGVLVVLLLPQQHSVAPETHQVALTTWSIDDDGDLMITPEQYDSTLPSGWNSLVLLVKRNDGFERAFQVVGSIENQEKRAEALLTLLRTLRSTSEILVSRFAIPQRVSIDDLAPTDDSSSDEKANSDLAARKAEAKRLVDTASTRLRSALILTRDLPDTTHKALVLESIASHYYAIGDDDGGIFVVHMARDTLIAADGWWSWLKGHSQSAVIVVISSVVAMFGSVFLRFIEFGAKRTLVRITRSKDLAEALEVPGVRDYQADKEVEPNAHAPGGK